MRQVFGQFDNTRSSFFVSPENYFFFVGDRIKSIFNDDPVDSVFSLFLDEIYYRKPDIDNWDHPAHDPSNSQHRVICFLNVEDWRELQNASDDESYYRIERREFQELYEVGYVHRLDLPSLTGTFDKCHLC